MASVVDICNLALGHLGDVANVSSISPPDSSAQAGHCARFYPISRDALLEMHSWGFATKRIAMALNANSSSAWQYCYSPPGDVLNYLKVIDPNASDDWSSQFITPNVTPGTVNAATGVYTPQPFVVEADPKDGSDILWTNQQNAVLLYTGTVTDPTRFSPLFTEALGFLLASKLAGPIIKGSEGRQVAGQMMSAFKDFMAKAADSDANQRRSNIAQQVSWIANR